MLTRALRALPVIAIVAATAAACGGGSSGGSSSAAKGGKALVGTFELTAGRCKGTGTPIGSYFRMVDHGGTVAAGPYFHNPDSPCKDSSYSLEIPGSKGGLVTGSYEPNPAKPFDSKGDALAAEISKPGSFTEINFSVSTNPVDPQTNKKVPAPTIYDTNGKLSGNLSAFSAAWNNQYFNQGSPKPGGGLPGLTTPVTGTYDASTGDFLLTWSSQIQGGAFDGFGGYWHLQGHFTPSS